MSPSPARWIAVIRASSPRRSAAVRTARWSEMNDAGVGTGGTNLVMAPPVGVAWSSRANSSEFSVMLDVADLERLLHGGERIALRHELLGDVAREPEVGDRFHHAAVVQLLRVIDLVASRHTAGVVMRDVLEVVPDRADHVAFHDLHVVDVVEELHPRRRDAFDDL